MKQASTSSKENVQQRILNAAEELFANSSYSATRISDIATLAGANQALVHYYFNSKEQLYQAVLERLFLQWEKHLFKQNWRSMAPEEMMQRYIESHFAMKCRVPNLYKIFHRETLEGGKLFNQYASAKWTEDYNEKIEMFKAWKKEGIINPNLNEQVVLFCIWGMMNQFYYRNQEALEMITGETGDTEALRMLIVEQMVALTQHGISNGQARLTVKDKDSFSQIVIFDVSSELEPIHTEKSIVIEAIQSWENNKVTIINEAQQLENITNIDLLLIMTSSKYGEFAPELVKLLEIVESNSELIVDRYIGIWSKTSELVNDKIQKQLESVFNKLGAFVITKSSTQTLHGYLNRCAKMSKV